MIKSLFIGCLALILCGCTLTTYRHYHKPDRIYKVSTTTRYYHPARHKHSFKKKRRAVIRHRHTHSHKPYFWHMH